ncbi:MAG: efflux RND transporter permease subunit [Muribaculaceae bacterium]|nr:efflux RND transporter permease subunit [Muribaculaceae bacterium]
MLDRIIRFSLDNRFLVLFMSFLILAAGMIALFKTEVDIFPDLNAPTVVVMTEAGGMAPEEVEQLVTFPVETALNGISGVRRVRSSSSTGFSVVWVEFDWTTGIKDARQLVAERLPSISSELPIEAGSPTMGPSSSILGEILIVGLTSDSISQGELRSIADRVIRPRLLAQGGVSSVSVIGGEVQEYAINLIPGKMKNLGVTLNNVEESLAGFNSNASGGVINDYDNEYLIKARLSSSDLEELGKTPVATESGGIITLADIAEIKLMAKTPEIGKASLNSQSAVLITVTKQPGIGSISLTDRLIDELESIIPSLPQGINVNTDIFRQASFIGNSVSNLQVSLFEGALFVIIVLFVFLMNIRTTLISAVAIPMSVIITLLIIDALGFSINTMTLGGIAIAIGSLVDDAIVDVENVYRHLRRNRELSPELRKDSTEVVFQASREVRMPILNSSLIIIASFLPLFFLSGMEGRLLIPLGISFIIALLASTIVALTLTPVLCVFLLGSGKNEKKLEKEPWLTKRLAIFYKGLLMRVLKKPSPVFILTGAFLIFAGIVFPFLGRSFLPSFNEGSFTVNVSALPGISLPLSDSIGRIAERLIREVPEVKLTARKTGRAELDEHSLGSNVSEIEVPYSLESGRKREEVAADIRKKLQTIPGVNIEIGQPISHRIDAMLSGSEAQIAVKIFGDNLDRLFSLGKEIAAAMGEVSGIVDVNVEQQIPRPEIEIKPKRELLAKYGITLPEFSRFIDIALMGIPVSRVYAGAAPYDITLKVSPDSRSTLESLRDLTVDTKQGTVPLSSISEIVSTSGPSTVNRENVSRRIVVSANVSGRDLRGAVNDIKKNIDKDVDLPKGYFITYGGQFESEENASRTLLFTSLGAILLIFFLLYAEFKDVKESLVILLNMPLAIIGGVLILWITRSDLNIPAIIGFISLLGISTRNGMLLISHYNQLLHEGIPLDTRVVVGSVDRLNPILMTGLSSALALIPLALRYDSPGNEIQAPMAIVILGGLISCTILNIFIVPAIYYLLGKNGKLNDECNCKECKSKGFKRLSLKK